LRFELGKREKIFILSVSLSLFLIVLGSLAGTGVVGNLIILSAFIVIGPQVILSYTEYREIKDIEEKFPVFIRNLIEALRSGMSFHEAIMFTSKSNYGSLTPYVKKMANQLSWGIPVEKVLEKFLKKIKRSRKLNIAVRIIIETFKSGGEMVESLESLEDSLTTLGDIEKERKSLFSQHIVLMYFICFVFVGIVIGIERLMLPIFKSPGLQGTSEMGMGFTNPCELVYTCWKDRTGKVECSCTGSLGCLPCGIYYSICSMLGIEKGTMGCYYTSLFFAMSTIQAIFSGLVAGQIGEGSLRSGLKHSLIMSSITVGSFMILTYLGVIGV